MNQTTLFRKRKRPGELFFLGAIYGAAYLAVFLLLGMIGYIFFNGFRVLSLRFFVSVTSYLNGSVGIAGNLVNTLYIMILTLLAAVLIGVGTAVYLNEYAKEGWAVRLITFATDTLAGIPSVIFGLFGMIFFGQVMGLGYSLLNGSLTLALMVLPLIVRNTQTALRAVPESYRNGALGLGATKWYLIRTILLPTSRDGILTGIILSVGRIAGESAALLFTAGSAGLLPVWKGGTAEKIAGLFRKIAEPGGTLTVELYLAMQNGEYKVAFGIGCVLIIMTFLVNSLLKLVCRQEENEKQ